VRRDWQWGHGPNPRKRYSVFKLPAPDVVYGLRAEYVKIEIPNEENLEGRYARGVRFYYRDCKTAPSIAPLDGAVAGDLKEFDARCIGREDLYQFENPVS